MSWHDEFDGWGGKRDNAGRKKSYTPVSDFDVRKVHSIYCSDREMTYLKNLLPLLRKYTEVLDNEKAPNDPYTDKDMFHSEKEFEEAWEKAKIIDLSKLNLNS